MPLLYPLQSIYLPKSTVTCGTTGAGSSSDPERSITTKGQQPTSQIPTLTRAPPMHEHFQDTLSFLRQITRRKTTCGAQKKKRTAKNSGIPQPSWSQTKEGARTCPHATRNARRIDGKWERRACKRERVFGEGKRREHAPPSPSSLPRVLHLASASERPEK